LPESGLPRLFDLAVIGGGINGTGIARDAAGRGLAVVLVEKGDLGGATSSASSKLIHGGLRYLEHFGFSLVRESLRERETLLRIAPHLVHPMCFVLPHAPGLRPAWMMRAGLWIYDRFAGRSSLPRSRGVDLARDPPGAGLKPGFRRGFVYSDCWTDDARLVVLNARAAADLGAVVLPRTECLAARPEGEVWELELAGAGDRPPRMLRARALVNAAGPWAEGVVARIEGVATKKRVRLVQGSHIVVPRLYEGRHAFLFQNDDRRFFFVIPFQEAFTLIGTTEVVLEGEPGPVSISDGEVQYLCRAAGRYLDRAPRPEDVCWSFAGIRPLFDDGHSDPSSITREAVLETVAGKDGPALVSVFGGKLTSYRSLAEKVMKRLQPALGFQRGSWTAGVPLPGGDLPPGGMEALVDSLYADRPGFAREFLLGMVRRHGTLAAEILGDAGEAADLGEDFGGGLREREVRWFVEREWARTLEDVLWRRTKAGLHATQVQRERLRTFLGR